MRRNLAAFALATSLFTSFPNPTGLLDPLWAWLSSFWSDSADAKAGIGLDPNGVNSPTPPPFVQAGCGLDPWGGQSTCTPPEI